jgi:hypothetical protein
VVVDAAPVVSEPVATVDAAPVVSKPPEPVANGTLVITTDTWCNLRIDGNSKGRHNPNAKRSYQLEAGEHHLDCSQGPGGLSKQHKARVQAGKTRTVRMTLIEPVRAVVRLKKGAAIRVGGKRVGNGQHVTLRPGRHSVAVVGGGGQVMGRGWVTVVAGKTCVLRDDPALGCFAR